MLRLPLRPTAAALASRARVAAAPFGRLQLRAHSGGHGHSHGILGMGHSHNNNDSDGDGDDHHSKSASDADVRAADRVTWTGIYVNVALSGVKGAAGVACNSAALLADAAHSLSDLVSDAITLAALSYCARPPDQRQPYGYGKYETVGALSVSLLLVGGSLGIIGHSLDTLLALLQPAAAAAVDTQLALEPEVVASIKAVAAASSEGLLLPHHQPYDGAMLHPAALGIAAVSVAAKEALYRATIRVGQRMNSSVLVANAWHHRSDAATSVVAMAGIGLSLAGLPAFDPLAGMLVGAIILKMGGDIGYSATKELCDAQLPDATVRSLAQAVDGVVRASGGQIVAVQQLRSRRIGRNVHVDLTLVMNAGGGGSDAAAGVSFETACLWKEKVKAAIQRHVPRVKDIIVELSTPEQAPSIVFEEQQPSQHEGRGRSHGHGSSANGGHGRSHSHSHSHPH